MAASNSLNISQQGTLYFDGISDFSGIDGSTAGFVLTSNGTGVAPSFQAGGGGITDVLTANASVQFTGVSTKTLDFANTNLVLGSPLTNLAGGTQNAGFGLSALEDLTSGQFNCIFGALAGASIQDGNGNVAMGWGALSSTISGLYNIAIGMQALAISTSHNNIAMGYQAGYNCISTSNSILMGYQTGFGLSSGAGNVAIGILAMNGLSSGSGNTVIGNQAGQGITGADSNNILINSAGVSGESGAIHIGTGGIQTECSIAGIAGVAVSNQLNVVIDSATGQLGTATNSLLSATITLTSAQIKNLNATPITIIPAQGAGKVIIPYSVACKFVYGGSNVFVAGASQTVNLAYNTLSVDTIVLNAVVVGSASSYSFNTSFSSSNLATASLENVSLTAYNPIATEISGNADDDNSIVITVQYYVVTM